MLVFNDGDMVGSQTTQGIDDQRDVIVVGWVIGYVILVACSVPPYPGAELNPA